MFKQSEMTPITIEVADMHYAACAWGDPAGKPVLALHGWLDNAASFDHLAPLLSGCYVVALDLAGHGHTSHRPASGNYSIWADLLDLLAIVDHLNWDTFHLIGHSRGAAISTLLATAAPERVSNLVLLDGLLPLPAKTEDTATQLQAYIRDERKYLERNVANATEYAGSVFTLDVAVEARQKIMPICAKSAHRIIERGTLAYKEGFRWRHDNRLKGASAIKLSGPHNEAIITGLKVNTLLMLTPESMNNHPQVYGLIDSSPMIEHQAIVGNHHFHMEEPAEQVGQHINAFFQAGSGVG